MAILNVTTGQLYRTIAEAARAAGVDASNIGKNLRGSRKSAGGYVFRRVEQAPTAAEYEKLLGQSRAGLTPQEVRARKKSRARSEQRAAATPPKPRRPAATPETRAAREKARAAMIKANAAARKAKKAGDMALYDKIRQAAAKSGLTSKTGLFDTRRGSLADIDADALRDLGRAAREAASGDEQAYIYQTRYGLASIEEAQEKKAAIDAFGISLGNLRDLSKRINENNKYDVIYAELRSYIKYLTPEEIYKLADEINQMADALRADFRRDMDTVLDAWLSETDKDSAKKAVQLEYKDRYDNMIYDFMEKTRDEMDAIWEERGDFEEDENPITW